MQRSKPPRYWYQPASVHQYISSEGFLVMASAELLLQLYTPFVLSCIQGFLFHNQATQTFYGYYIQASPRPCS